VRSLRELGRHTVRHRDEQAARSGFGSVTLLRIHLNAALGVPPEAYRRTSQGKP